MKLLRKLIRHLKSKKNVFGTSVTRAVESSVTAEGFCKPNFGWTDKFIFPPYDFKITKKLITNFHQPESTLLMLVSAFMGRENALKAYQTAVAEQYRFFSFGDAMMIL